MGKGGVFALAEALEANCGLATLDVEVRLLLWRFYLCSPDTLDAGQWMRLRESQEVSSE